MQSSNTGNLFVFPVSIRQCVATRDRPSLAGIVSHPDITPATPRGTANPSGCLGLRTLEVRARDPTVTHSLSVCHPNNCNRSCDNGCGILVPDGSILYRSGIDGTVTINVKPPGDSSPGGFRRSRAWASTRATGEGSGRGQSASRAR